MTGRYRRPRDDSSPRSGGCVASMGPKLTISGKTSAPCSAPSQSSRLQWSFEWRPRQGHLLPATGNRSHPRWAGQSTEEEHPAEARDSWAKESTRRWPWRAVQMLFLPLTSVRPFSPLRIDFLSSPNHVSRTPTPTCVISLLHQSPRDNGGSSRFPRRDSG